MDARNGDDQDVDGIQSPSNSFKEEISIVKSYSSSSNEETGENVYYVEEIMDKKKEDGRWLYLIKWSDWPSKYNTWEPRSNLAGCYRLLRRFQKKRAQQAKNEHESNKSDEACAVQDSANNFEEDVISSEISAIAGLSLQEREESRNVEIDEEETQDEQTLDQENNVSPVHEISGLDTAPILDTFPEGRVPQQIMDVFIRAQKVLYVIKWEQNPSLEFDENWSWIQSSVFQPRYPQMVFNFYQERLAWFWFNHSVLRRVRNY